MATVTDPLTLKPGDVLAGRYRLVRQLGEGGMGVVWEARLITTEKAVAIKLLKPRDDGNRADRIRFLREAKVAAGLSHRNIVQVFDFWDVEDVPAFLVMELLVGETLATVLERSTSLSTNDAVALLLPVASAMSAAHTLGVVHRDLKPDNVFLSRNGVDDQIDVKVLDFGLAKPMMPDAQETAITHTGSLMGTPFYMSPEQVYGEKNIDVASDVWSLGVVLYECLSGTRPFVGENFGQIFRAITQTSPRPLRELVPDVPPDIDGLVRRMLSRDRADRPTIGEVCAVLSSFGKATSPTSTTVQLQRTTQRLSSPPAQNTLPVPVTVVAAASSVRAASPSKNQPRRAMVAAVGAVMLVGLGISVTIALRTSPTNRMHGVVLPPPPLSSAIDSAGAAIVPPVTTVLGQRESGVQSMPSANVSPSASSAESAFVTPPPKPVAAADRPKRSTTATPPGARKSDGAPDALPASSAKVKGDAHKRDLLGGGRFN